MERRARGARLWGMLVAQGVAGAAMLALAACAGGTPGSGIFSTTPEQPRAPDPAFARTVVAYPSRERPGTIVVDPGSHFLYLVQGGGQAIRYGVGVGAEGFVWSGVATIHSKQELREHMVQLQSGLGMKGGPDNPIGARGMYLWQGNKDTLYRIHGTNEPWTVGTNVSSGCIRLTNDDVVDLYNRTPIGTKVVVLATARPAAAAQ